MTAHFITTICQKKEEEEIKKMAHLIITWMKSILYDRLNINLPSPAMVALLHERTGELLQLMPCLLGVKGETSTQIIIIYNIFMQSVFLQ